MSIFFNKDSLGLEVVNGKNVFAPNATTEQRVMREQFNVLQSMRKNGQESHQQMINFVNEGVQLTGNAARTPADAYREFDSVTKIEQVPAGEYATLTRLLGGAKTVNVGKKLYEYRRFSDMEGGQSSMSGQIGVKMDKGDYGYDGAVVPIHDKGFGIDWREYLAARSDGYDMLVDYSRESRRGLMRTVNNYLWDGNADLTFKGQNWLGLRNDPSVATATLGVDLSSSAATATDIRNEVARVRDILYITNNATVDLTIAVSREIASNWERPFATADASFGTIGDYIRRLRGIAEIYEDSELEGNEVVIYVNSQDGLHAVSGMAMSTYATPRQYHNDPYAYIMWMATGFMAKSDYADRKTAIYAS